MHNKNFYAKFWSESVSLDIFEHQSLRAFLYIGSWVVKIIAYLLLFTSDRSGKISKAACYIISYS